MKISKDSYLKNYWEYFLELEKQLLETKRFAEFDSKNIVYSIEYLKLFQAVCSEIDVLGKELASIINPAFKIDKDTTIKKWGFEIQQKYPDIKDTMVVFNGDIIQQPFKNWQYKTNVTINKNGNKRNNLKLTNNSAVKWWKDYNSVKHQRVGLVTGSKNYCLANQQNLVSAYCGLFVLESKMMTELNCLDCLGNSTLFCIKD